MRQSNMFIVMFFALLVFALTGCKEDEENETEEAAATDKVAVDRKKKVSYPEISIDNSSIVEGNKGNTTLVHFTKNHEVKKEVTLNASCFTINEGRNLIEFDYKGKGRVAGPEMIVNFRTEK